LKTYILQGSAATDLREGDSFKSSFRRRSFLNPMVENYENWSTYDEVIVKIKVAYFFLRHRVLLLSPTRRFLAFVGLSVNRIIEK